MSIEDILQWLTAPILVLAGWAHQRAMQARAEAQELRKELHEFKLDSFKTFVTNDVVEKMENRILARFDRLDGKFDRVLGRSDS